MRLLLQELRIEQRKQNDRKEEYNRKILQDKFQRDKERLDAEKEEKVRIFLQRKTMIFSRHQIVSADAYN